jgi:hypothetical protein
VGSLHVPQVTWVLHSDIRFERSDVRKAIEMLGEKLLSVEDLVRRMLFEVRSTPSGIDNDRDARVKSGIDVLGESFAVSGKSGVSVKGSATPGGITGWCDTKAGSFKHPLRCEVDITLPGIHDAAGEEIHIGSR